MSSVEVLGGHGTHVSCDSSFWYDPTGQSSHVPRVLLRYVPGEQLTAQCKIHHREERKKKTNISSDDDDDDVIANKYNDDDYRSDDYGGSGDDDNDDGDDVNGEDGVES